MSTMTREHAASEYKHHRSICCAFHGYTKESFDAEARTIVTSWGDMNPQSWMEAALQIKYASMLKKEQAEATVICADIDAYEAAWHAKDGEAMVRAAMNMMEHGWCNHSAANYAWGLAMTCAYPENHRDYVVASAWEKSGPTYAIWRCREDLYRQMKDRGYTPRWVVFENAPWLDGDPYYMDRYSKVG